MTNTQKDRGYDSPPTSGEDMHSDPLQSNEGPFLHEDWQSYEGRDAFGRPKPDAEQAHRPDSFDVAG